MKILSTLYLLFGLTNFSQAQSSVDLIVQDWERAKAYTKEYLDALPADKYGYKPTP